MSEKIKYKIVADYPGNTQPIGYTFDSIIGEYYDKFPAVFERVEQGDSSNGLVITSILKHLP